MKKKIKFEPTEFKECPNNCKISVGKTTIRIILVMSDKGDHVYCVRCGYKEQVK